MISLNPMKMSLLYLPPIIKSHATILAKNAVKKYLE